MPLRKFSAMTESFSTEEEAFEFAKEYVADYDLSYIPEATKENIIGEVLSNIHYSIIANGVAWHPNDIHMEIDRFVGAEVLSHFEWKAKNPGEKE
jgi:hypothetical protein